MHASEAAAAVHARLCPLILSEIRVVFV